MTSIRKIALLTGGGDCPGLNAVIRAVTRCAGHYGWEVIGFRQGYRGLMLNDYIALDYMSVSGLIDKGGTILGTSNRDYPFHFRSPGSTVYRDMTDTIIANLRDNQIDALIIIGGDGTLTAAEKLSASGIPIVCVPKTIDNDLPETDYTFGYHSACATVTEAIDNLHSTAEAHNRLMVVEVMGRHTGWIALQSGIAGGADIILIPELPYTIEGIISAIDAGAKRGKSFSIIIVSEGLPFANQELISYCSMTGSPRLGGIGWLIAEKLQQLTDIEARTVALGHLQRGGKPTAFDRILASRFGAAAVEAVKDADFGKMVALAGSDIIRVQLSQVAGRQKLVPADHELITIARKLGICFG
jgi:phosphofructokinase-like protein